jgi:hypothetical protein
VLENIAVHPLLSSSLHAAATALTSPASATGAVSSLSSTFRAVLMFSVCLRPEYLLASTFFTDGRRRVIVVDVIAAVVAAAAAAPPRAIPRIGSTTDASLHGHVAAAAEKSHTTDLPIPRKYRAACMSDTTSVANPAFPAATVTQGSVICREIDGARRLETLAPLPALSLIPPRWIPAAPPPPSTISPASVSTVPSLTVGPLTTLAIVLAANVQGPGDLALSTSPEYSRTP